MKVKTGDWQKQVRLGLDAREVFEMPQPQTQKRRKELPAERDATREYQSRLSTRARAPKAHALLDEVWDAINSCEWWTPEGKHRLNRLEGLAFGLGLQTRRGEEVTPEQEADARQILAQ